ncbi:MAG TPA: M10 family metallopeptidase C-terminal domain-containing protein [Allosphingosinicella sp.]|jgi:hypothetical protein
MPVFALRNEFGVNTAVAGDQAGATAAGLAGGGFVVTWSTRDTAQDGSEGAIKAQLFSANAAASGAEFLVNSHAAGGQFTPVVAAFDDGGFVIAWVTQDATQDGSGNAIKAQLFNAAGGKVGAEFLVNTQASGSQFTPNVTVLGNGNFVVSWDDWSNFDMKAQIFTRAGARVGVETRLNVANGYFEEYGEIAALAGGGFVATWRTTDPAADGSSDAVKARVFDSAGAGGAEFLVNTAKLGYQYSSTVAALESGGFVIAWYTSDEAQDGSSGAIKAQRFDAAGGKVGAEFLVNSQAANLQNAPTVAALPGDRFVVSWHTSDPAQDGAGMAVKAQAFAADGTKDGSEFLVNGNVSGDQFGPAVAALDSGNFVLVWASSTADGSGYGVRARLFGEGKPPEIVSDGGGETGSVTMFENNTLATTVAATDPAGADVVYAIGKSADAALFAIDAATGALRFLTAPNREAPADADGDNVYEVSVTASNTISSDTQLLLIEVADVDEAPVGTDGRDVFRLDAPGDYAAQGFGGVDSFYFGAYFTGADFVDGGADRDSLLLQGNYAVTLGGPNGSSIAGIESISLFSGLNQSYGDVAGNLYSYQITMLDTNVAAGALMKVNGFHLQAGENFTFDGSRETDAPYQLFGGLGIDRLTGGAQGDAFVFGHDGRYAPGDVVDGGDGYDVLYLRGDYDLDLRLFSFSNIESIALLTSANTEFVGGGDGEFDYNILWNDDLLARAGTMTVNASRLQAHETMDFDGSPETFGSLRVFGGAGEDRITGGGGRDQLHGGAGADLLTGGANADSFRYSKTSDSTAAAPDQILDFRYDDVIDLSGIDANAATEENESFLFIKSAAFSASGPGSKGEVRAFEARQDFWIVEADVNGDGVADLVIEVQTVNTDIIASNDFIL